MRKTMFNHSMFSPYYYHNFRIKVALKWYNSLWWKLMPGTTVKVKWPVGWAVVNDDGQGGQVSVESADPNDHYRPWMEKNVGKQGWDWDWSMVDNDIAANQITIKFRRKKEQWATIAMLKWS